MGTRIWAAAQVLACIGLTSGCASERISDQFPHIKSTPVCAITESPKNFIGLRVVVRARYMTDGSTYTYLLDPECSGDNVIDVSNLASKGNESVQAFRKSRKDACAAKGRPLLCTIEADLLAEVTVIEGRDGWVAIDLEKIIDYQLRP